MTDHNIPTDHIDVLIVGAGISGIDAAYRIQTGNPGLRYAILEARDAIGGTWDLFRYPGVRSDSDMVTLGFPFRPWRQEKSIADGADIRDYVRETARAFGIDKAIRFRHRAVAADWSSATARCSCAPAIMITPPAMRRTGRAGTVSPGASSIRNSGRRISTCTASASS